MNDRLQQSRPSRSCKRSQVVVACDRCRRSKIKCNGVRPICGRCEKAETQCVYATPWDDATPIVALKRKFAQLQRQSSDNHDIIDKLISASETDAYRIVDLLRSGEGVASALQLAHHLPAAGLQANKLFNPACDEALADNHHTSVTETGIASEDTLPMALDSGSDGPEVNILSVCASPRLPPFKSLLRSLGIPGTTSARSQRSVERDESPSILEMGRSRSVVSTDVFTTPHWLCYEQLHQASAQDWGVFYIDNETFRNIVCSYLVWDHPAWRFFDEDDFLDGLVHQPSVSCNNCLVHAIIAFGSKNYAYIDRITAASAGDAAAIEAERIFNEGTADDEDIATAAAGILIWNNYGVLGQDTVGPSYLQRSKNIFEKMRLSGEGSRSGYDPKISRAKAIFVWGVYAWFSFCESALHLDYSLSYPPPVPMPSASEKAKQAEWMPWPRREPRDPAMTDEIFSTRASIMIELHEVTVLERKHGGRDLTRQYLDACIALYGRLQNLWASVDPTSHPLDQPTPQLLLLHCWYHYTVVQLFRRFTTRPTLTILHDTLLSTANLPPEPVTSAATFAAQQLRQLCLRGSTLFAGLQTPVIFSQVAVAVAFDTLPSASAIGPTFSPSAGIALVAALRMLNQIGRIFPAVRLAVLGIKQAASRMQFYLPAVAEDIFAEAEREQTEWKAVATIRAGWVVDFNRAAADTRAATLENLIREFICVQAVQRE